MEPAARLALLSAGLFFLTALLTGVWKYLQIRASEDATAHPYVDIAHRASLMYSFAAILIIKFVEVSQLPAWLEWWAVFALVFYFGFAILIYIIHGALRDTDNQMKAPHKLGSLALPTWYMSVSMWGLIVAEIGGFLILFYGAATAVL